MNPFVTLLLVALVAITVIVAIALVPTFIVMSFSKKYALQYHAQLKERIVERLPGTDCGCCGCESCTHFAGQLIEGQAECSQCESLPEENALQLRGILEEWEIEQQRRQKASDDLKLRRQKHKPF